MRTQLAKETRQPPVDKKVQWPGVLVFEQFSEGIMIMISKLICPDISFDITSALEIAKCGANLVLDRKLVFSRNLECALTDFYGQYSPRDLHMSTSCRIHSDRRLPRKFDTFDQNNDQNERPHPFYHRTLYPLRDIRPLRRLSARPLRRLVMVLTLDCVFCVGC